MPQNRSSIVYNAESDSSVDLQYQVKNIPPTVMGQSPQRPALITVVAIVLANAGGLVLSLLARDRGKSTISLLVVFAALAVVELILLTLALGPKRKAAGIGSICESRNLPPPRPSRGHGQQKEMRELTEAFRLPYSNVTFWRDPGETRTDLLDHTFATVPYRVFVEGLELGLSGLDSEFS